MTKMYAVQANIERTHSDGYTSSVQVATFYLHPNVQGIRNEPHAERIARDILDPFARQQSAPIPYTLHISVSAVEV